MQVRQLASLAKGRKEQLLSETVNQSVRVNELSVSREGENYIFVGFSYWLIFNEFLKHVDVGGINSE